MNWTPGGDSSDIEDRRDETGGSSFGGFGGMHLGIGGTLLLAVLSLVFHQNLFSVFGGGGGGAPSSMSQPAVPDRQRDASEQNEVEFVKFVVNDTQHAWEKLLPTQGNVPYRHAKLVLYRDVIDSGCGTAQSSTGPFYCPQDEKVYLDLGFFQQLQTQFGAPGDFARAYVIAHELGHHVQKLLGVERQVRRLQQSNPRAQNPLSVRLELQADCFAGVWGHTTEDRRLIDNKDIEAGLRAAASVGDDRLQKMATGHVSPESFTHGSSAERMRWFQAGLDSGQISACNTFNQ